MNVTEYDAATGMILGHSDYPDLETLELSLIAGRDWLPGHQGDGYHYVANDAVTPRPAQATTLTGNTLTGLPIPATLWIDRASYAVEEAMVTLDLPVAGTYRLRVEAWPYLDWIESITV